MEPIRRHERSSCYASLMRTRKLNHSVYSVQYHLVWGTKYRRRYLKPYVVTELKRSFFETLREYPTLWIEKLATDEDHIHLQIEIPPNMTISAAVQALKIHSSLHLKRRFKFIRNMYIDGSIWSVGYFVSTVGINETVIKKYLDKQGQWDKGKTVRIGFS
jgi:putative transposase